MTFERMWVLALAALPLIWAAVEFRRSGRPLAVLLKAAAFLLVILAIAEPVVAVFETKTALAILVDTSASVPPASLEKASALATRIEKGRGRNWTRVLPFARTARIPVAGESGSQWRFASTSGEGGRGTNLEAAIQDAIASMPAGLVPRILLLSDGNENSGSAARAAWQARQLNIPIDTVSLEGRQRPRLRIESVSLPSQAFSGERFAVDLTLTAETKAPAEIEIQAEGRTLGTQKVELESGVNRFRLHSTIASSGAVDLALRVTSPGLGTARFEQALPLRRPRALLVSQDPPGTEVHLSRVLEANQFDVQRSPGGIPEKLDEYQLAIFNNWDIEAVPPARKAAIEEFVKQGGGLLWIAGERNVYVENKPVLDALERTLPAKLAPPRTPEGTCVVLIIDKSSSMEGKKMELARLAAIGVIENLRPVDQVGVLIFDNSFQWQVPIRKAEDRILIKRLVAGITPDGGTQIAPALNEAYRKILPTTAVYRHIVLLTDGISEEGDSISLSREASQNRVTISTVGLGQDVNRAYLEKVASFSKGKSYFLNDPSGLEQILLRDVMEHTGSTAVEKAAKPAVVKQVELLDGTGMETAPPLFGYVRFLSKPSAETILTIDQKDPLFSRWQYELGRAAVFASDAKSRWAANWVSWPGFDKFWSNVLRDLLPHTPPSEALASFDASSGELVVDYRLGRHVEDPASAPAIFALGPDFQSPMKVAKLAAGSYRARLPLAGRQGLFRVRPLEDSRAFPEIGFYREEAELREFGANEVLLQDLARFTGGRYNPPADAIFASTGRSVPATLPLWPGLLGAALLLSLAELLHRKWAGLVENFRAPAIN